MALKLANNAVSKLAANVAAADATISITAGDGSKFPVLAAGDWHPVTLIRSDGTLEILKCTARTNDTLTVTRGQESTVATTFSTGDRVELRLTLAAVQSMIDATAQAATTASQADTNASSRLPAALALTNISNNTTLTAADFPGIKNITATATISLPTANTVVAGKSIKLKSTTAGLVQIAPAGSDTIEGITSKKQMPSFDVFEIISDGVSNWLIINRNGSHVGDEKPHAGINIPQGWLLEDGSAISRTAYAGLFNELTQQTTGTVTNASNSITAVGSTAGIAVGHPISGPGIPANTTITAIGIGTLTISNNATATTAGAALVIAPHGVGDGSTTFNLPNRMGRTLIGAGQGAGLTNRILGAVGGEEAHTLTSTENGPHIHSASDSGHSHAANPAAYHDLSSGSKISVGSTGTRWGSTPSFDGIATPYTGTAYANVSIGSNGSGTPHNNIQPFGTTQYIIKT